MECGKRTGNGTITYPCIVQRTKETPDPQYGGFHEGPCAARENQQSMAARQRWESGAPARATMAAHQSAPQSFAQAYGAEGASPVPGSTLQPQEYRQAHQPVPGGFGEVDRSGDFCQHPFAAQWTTPEGAVVCSIDGCGTVLQTAPETSQAAASAATLRNFVQTHQAPQGAIGVGPAPDMSPMTFPTPEPTTAVASAAANVAASAFDAGLLEAARHGDPEAIERIVTEDEQGLNAGPLCPSSAAAGRQDRCGLFTHPPRCTPAGCSLVEDVPVRVGAEPFPGTPGTIDTARLAMDHARGLHETHSYDPDCERCALGDTGTLAAPTKTRPGDQVLPKASNRPIAHEAMQVDLADRLRVGLERYGQPLRPLNGRDTIQDAYEEVLDLGVYLKTLEFERSEICERFERAYAAIIAAFGDSTPPEGLIADLDATLAWVRGAPLTDG